MQQQPSGQQSAPMSPYAPVDQSGVTVDGLDIGEVVAEIHSQGFTVVKELSLIHL